MQAARAAMELLTRMPTTVPIEKRTPALLKAARTPVVSRSPFPLGSKKVYLPSFIITLVHTPNQPPQYATFLVPLNLTKLDLRDYLLHAYSVRTLSVTSRVLNSPVKDSGKPHIGRPQTGRLFRPAATKMMTVQLEEPFVWPPAPGDEDLEKDWNRTTYNESGTESKTDQKRRQEGARFVDEAERKSMKKQAESLLRGDAKWRPMVREEGSFAVRKGG